jgi:hypothetical protein
MGSEIALITILIILIALPFAIAICAITHVMQGCLKYRRYQPHRQSRQQSHQVQAITFAQRQLEQTESIDLPAYPMRLTPPPNPPSDLCRSVDITDMV